MKIRRLLLSTLVLGALLVPPASARPLAGPASPRPLASSGELEKRGGLISREDAMTSTVVVKFREGSDVRATGGKLTVASLLGRGEAATLVATDAVPGGVRQTFDGDPAVLRDEIAALEAKTGRDLVDLSLFVSVRTESPREALRLARALEACDEVEVAYVDPAPMPLPAPERESLRRAGRAAAAAPTSTPDFTASQYYLGNAPYGFGVTATRSVPGGRGEDARVIDIEYSWNLDHEDLPFAGGREPLVEDLGKDPFPQDKGNHGTAVLGMLIGADNGYGVTGICPDAAVGVLSPVTSAGDYQLGNTIKRAVDVLTRDGATGGIIQIEQQAPGINGQIAALPPEWVDSVYAAVQYAVARGVVVIEPAGNGGYKNGKAKGASLDDPVLGKRFDRKKRDSGAIMVGGAYPNDSSHSPTSNYGSRVDLQGYGLYVTTLGYGDLWGGDPLTYYTGGFSGTSSATPCVTGVAAIVQSTLAAADLPRLDSLQMRDLLAGTGSPDGSLSTENVGPRPNAELASRVVRDPATPFITSIRYLKKKGQLEIDGFFFQDASAPEDQRSVVVVDGQTLTTEYPAASKYNGAATRLVATGDLSNLLPPRTIVYVEVANGSGVRSPKRIFVRK